MGYEVKMMIGILTEQESGKEPYKDAHWFWIFGIVELPKFIGEGKFEEYHSKCMEICKEGIPAEQAFVHQIFEGAEEQIKEDPYGDPPVVMDPKIALKFLEADYNKYKSEDGPMFGFEAAISMLRIAIKTIEDRRLRVVCYSH